jgi:hypothetical protein
MSISPHLTGKHHALTMPHDTTTQRTRKRPGKTARKPPAGMVCEKQ